MYKSTKFHGNLSILLVDLTWNYPYTKSTMYHTRFFFFTVSDSIFSKNWCQRNVAYHLVGHKILFHEILEGGGPLTKVKRLWHNAINFVVNFFENGFTEFFNTPPLLIAVEVVYIWCWDHIGIQRYGKYNTM